MLDRTKELAASYRLALTRLDDSVQNLDPRGALAGLEEIIQLSREWLDHSENLMSIHDKTPWKLAAFLDFKECASLREAFFWVFEQIKPSAKLVAGF